MIELSPLVLLLLGELLLVSILVSLGLVVTGLIRKRNERQAIARLVGRIKEDETRRREETQSLMASNFGLEGEALNTIVNKISREEKRLYQALINLFLKRDLHLLEVLHVECEGVTEPYRTIELSIPDTDQDDLESDLSSEMVMLKEENERLTTELGVTMETMGTMLKEYASMYGGGVDGSPNMEKMAEFVRDSQNESQDGESPSVAEAEDISALDQDDSGMIDDAIDIDIGAALEDETVVIDGSEELAALNDETLAVDVNDDEFVELDDEDLNFEETGKEKAQE
ncbi:MAG: hypothetical protein GY792_20845 [Gammaproteobacteria bacterium]|nr:hypothetical protein [Gammaproteobacteria bacterium]